MEFTNKTASLARLSIMLVLAAMFNSCVQSVSIDGVDNCFYSRNLVYTHDLYDFTGNFSDVKEYWLRKKTRCIIIQDTNCRLEWYSNDISVDMHLSYDLQDGRGCQPIETDFYADATPYLKGHDIRMGRQITAFGEQ